MTTGRHRFLMGLLAVFASFSKAGSPSALLAVLLLGASANLSAQVDDDTRPFTPFRITVVPDGILNATMPFDVKFLIWGDVSVGTTEVTLDIRRVGDNLMCKPGAGTPQQRTSMTPRKWTARDYDTHDVMDSAAEIANKETLQFEVLVNELDPNAFYCMTFELAPGRQLTLAEAAELRQSLLPAFQNFLRIIEPVELDTLPQRRLEPLRQVFLKALLAASPRRITPRPGTMFDPNADRAQVAQEFNNDTLEVFTAHGQVQNRLENFERGATDPNPVNALVVFGQQVATAAKIAGLNPTLRTRLTALAGLTPEQASRTLYGLQSTAATLALTDSWQPDFSVRVLPPGGIYSPDDPCPERGELMNRCRLITQRRDEVVAIRAAAQAPGAVPNAAELTQASDNALSALNNQKINLLFIQNAVNARFREMDGLLQSLDARIAESFNQLATTSGSASTRRTWYVSADTGIAVAPRLNEVFPYVGTTMFFRPVNRAVPPGSFGTRFSMLFGVTWTNNLQKAGERKALFGENATVLMGAGLRITEWLRLTGGGVVFKAINPNPLLDKTELKITPFVSMSADIDAADVLRNLFGANAQPPNSGRVLTEK